MHLHFKKEEKKQKCVSIILIRKNVVNTCEYTELNNTNHEKSYKFRI